MKLLSLSALLLSLTLVASAQLVSSTKGQLVDSKTGQPLSYAHILLRPSGNNTVSNEDGSFLLELDRAGLDTIIVSYVGYSTARITAAAFLNGPDKKILLTEEPLQLGSIDIQAAKILPVELLKEALAKIPANYSATPLGLEIFFREQYKLNFKKILKDGQPQKLRTGYKVTEAVFEGYQPPYSSKGSKENGMLRLIKGRQVNISKDEDPEIDSLASDALKSFGEKGGPHEPLEYDLRKSDRLDFFDSFDDYNFTVASVSNFAGKPTIKIAFDQRDGISKCLYTGHVILDATTSAIIEIKFNYSQKKIDKAAHIKLLGFEITALDHYGTIKFRPDGNRWILSYVKEGSAVRLDINRKLKGHKIDASMDINQSFEVLVTKIQSRNPVPIPKDNQFGKRDVVDKKIVSEYDPDFWKGYSVLLLEANK